MNTLVILSMIIATSYSFAITHKLDYYSKVENGKRVCESLLENASKSECWHRAVQGIEEYCPIRSETPRLTIAAAFSHCTLHNRVCVDTFPLSYCLQKLESEDNMEMLTAYFQLVDDLCFYLSTTQHEEGRAEFLISPTLSAMMTFRNSRE